MGEATAHTPSLFPGPLTLSQEPVELPNTVADEGAIKASTAKRQTVCLN